MRKHLTALVSAVNNRATAILGRRAASRRTGMGSVAPTGELAQRFRATSIRENAIGRTQLSHQPRRAVESSPPADPGSGHGSTYTAPLCRDVGGHSYNAITD